MIRPLSQGQLKSISSPGQAQINQFNQTLQNLAQNNRQSRLDKMRETAFNTQQEKDQTALITQQAPLLTALYKEAANLPQEQRLSFLKNSTASIPQLSSQFDETDTSDDAISQAFNVVSRLSQKSQKPSRVFEGVDDSGQSGFFTREGNTLQRIQGAVPREKSALVNIGSEEKEEDKAFGKFLVKDFGDISARATASEDNIQQLKLAQNIDVSTGKLEPLKAWGSSIIQGLGLDPDSFGLNNATNAESFNAIMGNVLATKLAAQKGPQTDRDADRMKKTLASLGNTPEAKEFLLNSAIALSNRQVEQRDFYASHKDKTGSFKGASKAWKNFIRKTPIFGKNPNSGRPVFFNEFKSAMFDVNDNITDEQVLELWREKYNGK